MVKETCNLIGQQYILATYLEFYVMNDKTTLFLGMPLIFYVELLLLWSYHPQTNEILT